MSEEITKEKSLQERLQEPFRKDAIEWRVQSCGRTAKGDIWALVLPYIANRAIQDRLDEVVGVEGWINKFQAGPDGGVLCGISIRINGEWLTKWDGAENTNIEAVKGGISGAMKRAAVQWGIGRYLYELQEEFVHCELDNKFKNQSGWKPARLPKKEGGQFFYFQIPELPAWALMDEERIYISMDECKTLKTQLHNHKIPIKNFASEFRIEKFSELKKEDLCKCSKRIIQNSNNPDAGKVEFAEEAK